MNKRYIANASKPIGELGRKRVAEMNEHHAPLIEWGFSFLPQSQKAKCVDLGCGGGGTVSFLLHKLGASYCFGVDYSKVAVEEASKNNREAIAEGKCSFFRGDVSALPLMDESFDLVSAVETLYFWNDPVKALQEARRVLKANGKIIIINEDDGEDKQKVERLKGIMPDMRFFDAEQLSSLLAQAGFSEIETHSKSPWIAAIGQK